MLVPALLSLLAAAVAPQQSAPARKITFVESFEGPENAGGWSFFGNPANPIEVIEPAGGHPGRFLHSTCAGLGCLDTFAPELRTQLGSSSPFTGDYRANGVVELGVDLAVFGPPGVTTGGRPLSLILRNDGGTPSDASDDVVVARVGARNIPAADGHWRAYSFRVPSQRTTLPGGWLVLQGSGDDDADWNLVVGSVTRASFFFGDPQFFFIFQQWELGVDRVRVRLDADALP